MIRDALVRRKDLLGWQVRHHQVREAQLFHGRSSLDARRMVEEEDLALEVLCASAGSSSPPMCGAASANLSIGDDPEAAIEFAIQAARRTRNPLYALPRPATLPEIPLVDPEIEQNPAALLESLRERLVSVSEGSGLARLTLAEWFAGHKETRLVNSQGIDVRQRATMLSTEWVVLAGEGDQRVETVQDRTRRRALDLDVETEWVHVARQTADRQRAASAPTYQGPVVLHGPAISAFLQSEVIDTLASAHARFAGLSHWEIGKPVFKGETRGDPLTLWANRTLPFGTHASRFDREGIPGQRIRLIQDGILQTYVAGQRHGTYLDVPVTGAFGDLELPPGSAGADELVAEPHVEIALWSWFSPDPTTGDFASEIRLGYHVADGERRPFSGGMLVGNLLEALADVRWSRETVFLGDYLGPASARFTDLRVAPSRG